MAAFHPRLAVLWCQGCALRGMGLCRREGGSVPQCLLASGRGWGATRNTGMALLVALGETLPRGAESPGRQRLPALLRSGSRCWVAAHWWPFPLWGYSAKRCCVLAD